MEKAKRRNIAKKAQSKLYDLFLDEDLDATEEDIKTVNKIILGYLSWDDLDSFNQVNFY